MVSIVTLSDGKEVRRKREKIITRELAETHRIANEYTGPVTKTDAQRVLDLLIAADSGRYIAPKIRPRISGLRARSGHPSGIYR